MDPSNLDFVTLLKALTSGDKGLIFGAIILIVVWAAKRFTPETWLTTTWEKRGLTIVLAIGTASGVGLLSHQGWYEIVVMAAIMAVTATGLHHWIDNATIAKLIAFITKKPVLQVPEGDPTPPDPDPPKAA